MTAGAETIAIIVASAIVIIAAVGTAVSARANRRRIEAANESIQATSETIIRVLRPPK